MSKCKIALFPFLYREEIKNNAKTGKFKWRKRIKGDKIKRKELIRVEAEMKGKCKAKISITAFGDIKKVNLKSTPPLVPKNVCTKKQRKFYWVDSFPGIGGKAPANKAKITFNARANCKACGCKDESANDNGSVTFVNDFRSGEAPGEGDFKSVIDKSFIKKKKKIKKLKKNSKNKKN